MNNLHRVYFTIIGIFLSIVSLLAQIPAGYYNSAEGKNEAQLKTALCQIISSHTVVSYTQLWNVFRITDLRSDGYLWDIYSECNFLPGENQCARSTYMCGCVNREHSFPKSWWGGATNVPMYSDIFHIYPVDSRVNGQRSNYPYGECAYGTVIDPGALGRLGTSTFSGYTGKVFEPIDEYKGDLARTYFYMVTRYESDLPTWPGSPQLNGTVYPAFSDWSISLLLEWNRRDSVSSKETDRNNKIYTNYQHNRNPFIDHPELAEYIWGDKKNENWYTTSSINTTKLVFELTPNPASDQVHVKTEKNLSYKIFSQTGQLIKSGSLNPNESISTKNLPDGSYFIQFNDKNVLQTEKLIIKN